MSVVCLRTAYSSIQQMLPNGTREAVIKSFVYSGAAVMLLSGGNILAGATMGAIAATASLVDSIATAVIRKMVPGKVNFEWYESYAKMLGAFAVVNLLAFPLLGSVAVNVLASGVFIFITDLFRGKIGNPVPINFAKMLIMI